MQVVFIPCQAFPMNFHCGNGHPCKKANTPHSKYYFSSETSALSLQNTLNVYHITIKKQQHHMYTKRKAGIPELNYKS